MKPPRTLFSLGRPGAKPAATAVDAGTEATADASGTDTVVDTVAPADVVEPVEVVEPADVVEPVEVADAPAPTAPAPDEAPVADAGEVAPAAIDHQVPLDEPGTSVAEPVALVEDAAVAEPTIDQPMDQPMVAEAAAGPEAEPAPAPEATWAPEPAPEPEPEPAFVSDVDVSVEESGYLCGACDAPLPVGAAICAACGTPVAGAELYEDLAPEGQADVVAESFVAGAAVDDRATIAPDAPTFDAGPAEVAQPAAVLYGEGSGVEPLPPAPEGSWGITQPSFGGVGDDLVDHPVEPAEPAAEVAAAGVVGAAAYGATNAWAGEPATATAVPVGPATSPGYGGADASSMPYGTGAVTTSEKSGSKAPIWIAAAVVVVLVGLIGGIMIAGGGSKSDDGNGAAAPTTTPTTKAGVTTSVATTVKPTTPTTAAATTPSTAATTSPTTAPTTDTTAAPTSTETPSTVATTASTVVITTVATTAPRQTTIITSPPTVPTTIAPGSISPSQPNGAELRIPKGGRTSITFTNTGGRPASCAISVGSGNLSLDRNCSPSIAAGSSVTINITANPGFEGAGSISGLLEGVGSYTVPIFVKNG